MSLVMDKDMPHATHRLRRHKKRGLPQSPRVRARAGIAPESLDYLAEVLEYGVMKSDRGRG